MRIAYEKMKNEFLRVLRKYGFNEDDALLGAALFTDASCDGVYTHGLNRFPKFIKSIDNGSVNVKARAVLSEKLGPLERWDGKGGPGNLNAHICMKRAIELAGEHTLGCVALSNTNHWMRPGAYGLMAAEANCMGILWTNTVPNMPPWGGSEAKLGNNPVVIAIPHGETPILLDIAMSMFSYGKLEKYVLEGRKLPFYGGFDREGNMTDDPSAILDTHRTLPIGYWKGSGLSLVLDLLAATLSGGSTSRMVGTYPYETNLSQVFFAVSLDKFGDKESLTRNISETLADLRQSAEPGAHEKVHFPGEGMVRTRVENRKEGIPVDEKIWNLVTSL